LYTISQSRDKRPTAQRVRQTLH